ncbi:F-box domain containing protein [Stemphylium lycopersici]|nr:F-box domain containing protein [Stemphylium lycopersici]
MLLRNSKKSATILRAVPENAKCEAGLQGDVTAQDQLHTSDEPSPSSASPAGPSPSKSGSIWCRKRVPKSIVTKSASASEMRKSASHCSLKGAIGTYKHGKIQWRRKEESLPINHKKRSKSAERPSKPKIEVVIPAGRCDRPLPTLPFFDSSPAELESNHAVSPPSASHRLMRDSIVSPLSQPQAEPITSGHPERTMSQIPASKTRASRRRKSAPESSSSSNDSQESDASSLLSNRSSKTSLELDASPRQGRAWQSLSVRCGQTLVPEGTLQPMLKNTGYADNESYRNAPSLEPPRRYTHEPSSERDSAFQAACGPCAVRPSSYIVPRKPTLNRKSSKRSGPRQIPPPSSRIGCETANDQSASRHSSKTPRGPSPTLSEAECDLHKQLVSCGGASDPRADDQGWTTLAEDSPFRRDRCQPSAGGGNTDSLLRESALVGPLDTLPPAVPRKSSKRQSAVRRTDLSRLPLDHIASQAAGEGSRVNHTLTLMIPENRRSSVDLVLSLSSIETKQVVPTITPAGAEIVILNILRHLGHFQDLFAAALINHGFYRVFKRHELDLIKSTLRTMSPPAWEFREFAFPGHDLLHAEDLEMKRPEEEYTPTTYLQLQKQDVQIMRAIKEEILEKCQSFVRQEIAAALVSASPVESARVDDALWRIWTFCKIFGSGKGREDDIVAQMDWLKGGALAHQETCTFSIMSTDFMNDPLVGVSESFAKGNEGGLSAEQLFDMMELWNCLAVLLQSFEGRTVQARQAGIYDNTDIRGGDIDGEEMMLDEWCYHLLTFGPATVLKLTGPYHPSDATGFAIAAEHGWADWKPPAFGGTRRHFLKEAASRVYEDKIAHTYAKISTRDVQRQQSKIRIQRHISELRNRKNSGERRPTIRMSQERPMSDWDTVIRNLTRPSLPTQGSSNDIVTHVPALRTGSTEYPIVSELPASRSPCRTPSPPLRTVAQPLLPTPTSSTVPSTQDRRSTFSHLPMPDDQPPLPPRRILAEPLLPSPSTSTAQSNRDLYTMGSVSDMNSPPRRTAAQPLLPTPSPSTVPNARDWHRYSTGTSMPSIREDAHHHHHYHNDHHHPLSEAPAPVHPLYRPTQPFSFPHPHQQYQQYHQRHQRQTSQDSGYSDSSSSRSAAAYQQHEQQHHIFGSQSHENTAEKAIYRIVEMGFTPEQARDALRVTDLGTGLRVDRAVELLLSRQS